MSTGDRGGQPYPGTRRTFEITAQQTGLIAWQGLLQLNIVFQAERKLSTIHTNFDALARVGIGRGIETMTVADQTLHTEWCVAMNA